jgi:putative nucleotidyltransferase with HDIG domain
MAKLIILCGLPGSGKSYYAEQLLSTWCVFCEPDTVIHSSDAIRKELFGDAGSQENNALVFDTMHKRVREDLRAGKTVIYDATNITRKSRRGAINLASKDDVVECHIVWTPIHTCIKRDAERERSVGKEVIDKMLRRWQSPHRSEGFSHIEVICSDRDFNQVDYIAMHTAQMHIPHDNPHHTLGVWEHCMQARCNLEQCAGRPVNVDLKMAAMWHDIGKPYTKGYKADKETGVIDYSHAHYYDHHCVGGYLTYGLFLHEGGLDDEELDFMCWVSWLVCNHMEPFFNSKYYRGLPEYLKQSIDILHEADVAAH